MEHIENEKIQQEKELAQSWRKNNPEEVKEYLEKWIDHIENEKEKDPEHY